MRGAWRVKDLATRWLGRSYIAGASIGDAVRLQRRLDLPVTFAYWDGPVDGSERVDRESMRAVDAASAIDAYVSLKLPSLGDLEGVASHARDAGVRLHFDSLAADVQDDVVRETRTLLDRGVRVGLTVPGRWSRSRADLEALAGSPVHVRIVKGQWPGDRDAVEGFLELAGLARGSVALATHDAALAREATQRLAPGVDLSFELLYGLPVRSMLALGRELGVPVRIYLPYGHGYFPYALDRLRENPRMLWWLARDAALGRRRF
jgi:proline dehydrogenase